MYTTLQVTALSARDVPASLFKLEPKPGELVRDEIRKRLYFFQPVGEHTIDESIADVRRQHRDTVALERSGARHRWGLAVSIALVFQAAVTVAFARRRNRRKLLAGHSRSRP